MVDILPPIVTIWYMNDLSSTEFRKSFAGLSEPTFVTVHGHPIGVWLPGPNDGLESLIDEIAHLKRELAARPGAGIVVPATPLGPVTSPSGFGRSYPAPKSRSK